MTIAEPAQPQSIYLDSQDSPKLHVLRWPGPAGAPKVLLLHGFTHHAWVWWELAQRLATRFDIHALDFRGHGDSAWDPEQRYMHEHLQQDVCRAVDELALHGCHLIGHSLGARVAMLALQQHGQFAASFTIIDTGPDVGAAGAAKVRTDAESQPHTFASVDIFHGYLRRIYTLAQPPALAAFARHSLRPAAGGHALKMDPAFTQALWKPSSRHNDSRDLRAPLNEQLWQALATLDIPVLLLRGAASAILSRRTAEKMANDVIRNARLVTIPMAGHAVLMDNPDATIDAIGTFLQQLTKDCDTQRHCR